MAKKSALSKPPGTSVASQGATISVPWPTLAAVVLAFAAGYGAKQTGKPYATPIPAPTPLTSKAEAASPSTSMVASTNSTFGDFALVSEAGLGDRVGKKMEERLAKLLEGTFTAECKNLVRNTFEDIVTRVVTEDFLPFERESFKSECKAKAERGGGTVAAADVRLAYLLLVHEQPEQVERIVDALWEPQHHFLVHVDMKPASENTLVALKAFVRRARAAGRTNVHLMADEFRKAVSWGGFNVVQATLNGIHYATADMDLDFHWMVPMSGYTYPLFSNADIRARLASYPTDTNFFEIAPQGNKPAPRTWHHFIECDNAMRRVWRLAHPKGITMYAGSQWFVMSRAFAKYVAPAALAGWSDAMVKARPGAAQALASAAASSFPARYAKYGKHTMVADENFFSTVFKNSHFCHTHENFNFVNVQFDQWEHEKPTHKADPSKNKCLMPNPNHCGRSPTTTTLEYLPVLDLADTLFARKFDPAVDATVLDAIDEMRATDKLPGAVPSSATLAALGRAPAGGDGGDEVEEATCTDRHLACRTWAAAGECLKNPGYMLATCAYSCNTCPPQSAAKGAEGKGGASTASPVVVAAKAPPPRVNFIHGVVLALPAAGGSTAPAAAGVPSYAGLQCVTMPPNRGGKATLAPCNPGGTKGQRLDFGPCSSDGSLSLDEERHVAQGTKGNFSVPYCQVKATEVGGCLDVANEKVAAGSKMIVWPCHKTKWNQLFTFRDDGSMFINIPFAHHRDQHMCIEAASATRTGDIQLASCDAAQPLQRFEVHRVLS